MTRSPDSLPALRDHAVGGLEHLGELLELAAGLGAAVAGTEAIQRPFRQVGGVDPALMAAEGRRLSAAHRSVAERLHRLPEQQVRLDRGWTGETGSRAVIAVIEHQRRAEADLHVLRTLAEATAAAAAGIDQLLRTWYLTVARLSVPLAAGVPIGEVPGALASGRLRVDLVVDDIVSRVGLYFTTAEATITGIDEIVEHLDRATEDLAADAYPGDTDQPSGAVSVARASVPNAPTGTDTAASTEGDTPDRDTPDRDTPDRDTDVPLRLRSSTTPTLEDDPEQPHQVPSATTEEAASHPSPVATGAPALESPPADFAPAESTAPPSPALESPPPASPPSSSSPAHPSSGGELALAGEQ